MNATGSEASVVARRILDTYIPPLTFGGYSVDSRGGIEILVNGQETLSRAGVALHLGRHGQFTDRWSGVVDDIDVTLRLEIPHGVFPAPAPKPRAA